MYNRVPVAIPPETTVPVRSILNYSPLVKPRLDCVVNVFDPVPAVIDVVLLPITLPDPEPIMLTDFVHVIPLDHVNEPAGSVIVSPVDEALIFA